MIGPEWDRISGAGIYLIFSLKKFLAKNLIQRCLIPDTSQRITIEKIMDHKWISYYNKNPDTPLATTEKFVEKNNLFELSVNF